MSRVIRKVENEDWYIVYCNTADIIFPQMFRDREEAESFITNQEEII